MLVKELDKLIHQELRKYLGDNIYFRYRMHEDTTDLDFGINYLYTHSYAKSIDGDKVIVSYRNFDIDYNNRIELTDVDGYDVLYIFILTLENFRKIDWDDLLEST